MRYLLDTNVISNLVKPAPSPTLMAWLAERMDQELYISTLTLAEIQRGVLEKPAGKRRDALDTWFRGKHGPQALFAGRILPFDEPAALIWGRLMAAGRTKGKPRSALDMMIAAIAEAYDCTLVTDNEKDFAGIETLNPIRAKAT